ncbi:hypothetical protein H4J46_01540 [Colwellia sp. MB02u-6]|jgi:hypothetical protein|nr:hypothetical protein [Colwellia sp. MB02u-6]MBA6326644.1 hypothetical protein [Colwellia sp. MB02u-6]
MQEHSDSGEYKIELTTIKKLLPDFKGIFCLGDYTGVTNVMDITTG